MLSETRNQFSLARTALNNAGTPKSNFLLSVNTKQKAEIKMKTKEVFGLVLRTFGMIGLAYCIRRIVRNPTDPALLLLARVVFAAVAVYMIRGAPLLLKFAYPECAEGAPKPSA